MLYMFRTILVHLQEQLYKLYIAYGICRFHTSGCCVAIATQQPDVPAYTDIYQMRCTAYKVAPEDGLIQSETCRAFNEKWSLITRILCILLVYIHTATILTYAWRHDRDGGYNKVIWTAQVTAWCRIRFKVVIHINCARILKGFVWDVLIYATVPAFACSNWRG